jgi:tetratricopeptide (TPR) repeat protein
MAEVKLENAPRKAKELFDKAFAAMERGNLDYAMDMFLQALELEPNLLKAREYLRAAELRKFKEKKGGALLHTLSSLQGCFTLMSGMSMIKKKPAQAVKTAEKLMRLDPLNMSFINFFAQAALAASMPETAIQTLELAKNHYPNNIPLLKWLGKLYIEHNEPHKGRECMEALVRLQPNDPKALKNLKDAVALDTMKKGGWDEGSSFRDMIKDTKEAVLLEQESKAVKSSADLEALIVEMERKVEREPENINYRRALADFYTRAERFDEALKVLTDAQATSGRADPQIERAISNIRVRQFDAEIAKLKAANDVSGADVREKEKQEFLLKDAADRARRYPNDLQFRYEYGVLLFERNLLNDAIEEFQLSQRNPQRRIRSLYFLALCFKQKSQYDIALEQLEKAASELSIMDDTKKDIVYEMGLLCEAMGQTDKASAYFKEIYAVDIRYKDVAAKIEKYYKK